VLLRRQAKKKGLKRAIKGKKVIGKKVKKRFEVSTNECLP